MRAGSKLRMPATRAYTPGRQDLLAAAAFIATVADPPGKPQRIVSSPWSNPIRRAHDGAARE